MPKKIGIYIRVSTQEQVQEGYSIEAQTDRLSNYCKAKDWNIYHIYTDGGFSGSNMNRPAMQKLIDDIKNHRIDCVLVYKLDRLSRSQKDTLFLIEDLFLRNNVEFVSMNENFDTSTPFGRATIGILSVFAQLEREQIKERSAMGRTERAKNGYWHGGGFTPFGYNYVNGDLIIDEFQAMQVKEAYKMYLDNVSIYQITNILNEKYKQIDHESTVRSILTTPLYKGVIQWNGNTYQGKHEPIIDELTYAKVEKKYKSTQWQRGKGSMRRPYQVSQLLSSLMYCENCGARYFAKGNYSGHGDKKRYYPYYYCYSRAKTRKSFIIDPDCKNPVYAVEKLDLTIINEIKKLATDDKYIYEAKKTDNNSINSKRNEILKNHLVDINKQISRMLDLYQIGNIGIDDINKRLTALQDEKSKIEYQINSIDNQNSKLSIPEVKKILDGIGTTFEGGTFQEKRNIILSLIEKITIKTQQDEFRIHWNF